MFKKLGLIALCAVSAFAMHSAELNINDKDLEVSANFDLGQFNDTVEPDTSYIGFSYLKASDEHSTDRADINGYADVNFIIKQELAKTGIKVGIGIKANYAQVKIGNNDEMFFTIPLGVEVGYKLPFGTIIPIIFGAELYYAPESLSFAEANSFLEYRANVEFEILDRGSIVAGYRNINTNYKINTNKIDINYNKSVYVGFKFSF